MIQNSVPKSAFVPRQDLRGELTSTWTENGRQTGGCSRWTTFPYRRQHNVDIKRDDGSAKVVRDCERKIKHCTVRGWSAEPLESD